MISSDEGAEAVSGSLGYFAPMTMLEDTTKLSDFRRALELRLGHAVDPGSKAFFYGALSYDHILAVAYAIRAIKDDDEDVNRRNMMAYLRKSDFDGATGRIRIVPGRNDRADMPVQIVNSHGYDADGKTVKFVSVGFVNPKTGILKLDEGSILWPGGSRTRPAP